MEKKIKKNLTPKDRALNALSARPTGQVTRPPVAVVLGHIDHGKTTLLDQIRKTHVAEKESGGITQHIGAYQIEVAETSLHLPPSSVPSRSVKDGKKITFIDTPGHEAFSAMRARGAKVADIAILVVDCCEGVKEQTKEAISHAKLAGIPVIVALNKIDKTEANPEKTKRELSKEDILVESLGGKIPSVEISAKTGKGIPELLELILLIAEMEDLKTDISKPAEGVVIESYLDANRGPTTTLILENGALKKGNILGTSSVFGKIKIVEDFQGRSIEEAFPSMPVIVLGFESAAGVGEKFKVFPNLEEAKNYLIQLQQSRPKTPKDRALNALSARPTGGRVLNLILKIDVLGSLEAIKEVLKELPQDKVVLRILKEEVGQINESDVKFAKAHPVGGYPAVILGFRVKINRVAQELAEREKIKIMTFEVIYDLIEGIRKFIEKILKPEAVRTNLGEVKVLAKFLEEKNRLIVGGKVIKGEAKKGVSIEVFRGENLIGKGKLINLQRDKKDIDKVIKGQECGILFEGEAKIEGGDTLVIYTEEKRKTELSNS